MHSIISKTEDQQDRKPYYCTWSRASAYFSGVFAGTITGILIMSVPQDTTYTRMVIIIGALAFFAANALYFYKRKGGEPVEEKK